MSTKHAWVRDIKAARNAWQTSKRVNDYEVYAMACAAYLCSDTFEASEEHWFCGNKDTRRIAISSLIMFSFTVSESFADPANVRYKTYEARFTKMLSSCQKCAISYQCCDSDLVEELAEGAHIEQDRVSSFLQALLSKDRQRLACELAKNTNRVPNLTEIMWSFACVINQQYINRHVIEPDFLSGELGSIATIGACPGFLLLSFSTLAQVRRIALNHINSRGGVQKYAQMWKEQPLKCRKMLNYGLKRVYRAEHLADMAWYTASVLLNMFTDHPSVIRDIVEECVSTIESGWLGAPKFGAHALVLKIMRINAANNGNFVSKKSIETLVKYVVTGPTSIERGVIDSNCSEAARLSESYQKLGANMVTEWLKLYIYSNPEVKTLHQKVQYLLRLKEEAFATQAEFDTAARLAVKVASLYCKSSEELVPKVLNECGRRVATSFAELRSDSVLKLWQFQLSKKDSWVTFWTWLLRDSNFVPKSLSSRKYNGVVLGILQGSRNVAVRFQLPTSRELKWQKDIEARYEPSKAENFVIKLLESLTETADSDQLLPILLDKHVLRTVLLLGVSGYKRLSLTAIEFMKQAADADSRESLDHFLVKEHTELTLNAVNSLLAEASPASTTWLAVMPGLLRLALNILDEVYSTHDGVDTTGSLPTLKLLHQFWQHSWDVVTNVIKSIRTWAKEYAVSHVKSVLTEVLEFGQGLLSKFRLLESDLNSGMPGSELWSASLADSAISCINSMGDMLQLAIPELLAAAVSIIIEILGLTISFKVTIPDSLLTLLEDLATKRMNSRLTKEQLRELLSAASFSDEDITVMIESKISSKDAEGSVNDLASPVFKASPVGTKQHQTSLGDYFKSTGGQKPIAPPRQVVNSQVVPQSQHRPSALSTIRSQLSKQQHDTVANLRNGNAAASIGVVHPGRPPGFNPPKSKPLESHDSSSDEDLRDEPERALTALGAKQKQDGSLAKLREAYLDSQSSHKVTPAWLERRNERKSQLQKEQNAKISMKKRLSAKPTEFHKVMLSWDFYATKSPFEVASSIPDTFDTVKHYQDIMAPLLYREAWEQVQQSKEELEKSSSEPFILVFGKQVKVDGFTDVYVSMSKESYADAGLGEGDLLLLTYDKARPGEPVQCSSSLPHCFARYSEGSTKRYGNATKGKYVDFQVRLNEQTKVLSSLSSGSMVSGMSMGNMRTVEREFSALMALPYYDLLDQILKARPAVVSGQPNQIQRLQDNLKLNRSQATAVSKAMTSQGFSLIQGPPGTGKTKTILGIIGAFFTSNALVAQTTDQQTQQRKILICAPSNAAVDEIVLRLKDGITDSNGQIQKLSVLRLGRLDVISDQVKDMTLESHIDKALTDSAEPVDQQLRKDHTSLTAERNQIKEQLKDLEEKAVDAEAIQGLRNKLKELGYKIREKSNALDMQRERLEQAKKNRERLFREKQNELLSKAQVVCTTLSGSAHPVLASLGATFNTVIIDEAAQSVELSSLIPLKYGCETCIMVGDPNQLPPTVISREASRLKYDQSLFVRMFNQYKDTPDAISMLDTQFRMHPDIAKFPSDEFYFGKLQNGEGLAKMLDRPWHRAHRALGPYTFFEIKGEHERGESKSLQNVTEASAAIELVNFIKKTYGDVGSIGVISPYREQVRLMRRMFSTSQKETDTSVVDFNSIDGFQGQEKDIIIISCVRASDARTNHIGFLSDVRRMNVALTRAKTSLWILGRSRSLAVNPVWAKLIEDADSRGMFVPSHAGSIVKAIKHFDNPSRPKKAKIVNKQRNSDPRKPSPPLVAPSESSSGTSSPVRQEPQEGLKEASVGTAPEAPSCATFSAAETGPVRAMSALNLPNALKVFDEQAQKVNGVGTPKKSSDPVVKPSGAPHADPPSSVIAAKLPTGPKHDSELDPEAERRPKKRKKKPDSVFIQPRQRRVQGKKAAP